MQKLQARTLPDKIEDLPDPGSCLLCGMPHSFVAIYRPDRRRQRRYRPRPAGFRVFIYGLCGSCSELPDVFARVELHCDEPLSLAMLGGEG